MLFLLLAQLCIVPTLSLAQSSGPADACKKMNGTDFSAEDKGVEVPSRTADDCCEICSLDPKCQVGVFTVATGVCALMTSFKTNGVKKAGVVSYIYPPPAPILPVGTMDLSKYTVTWDQDFSKITNLSVSPHGEWPSTWISHTPSYKDWNDFQEQEYDTNGKMVPYHPFNLGDGKLTIRAQQQTDSKGNLLPGKYWGGLLCSVDTKGNGFAQKYGYFEWKAKLPKGPGTWPAFWLLDRPSLVNGSINAHELDIVEQYGDGPGVLHVTLHNWYHTKAYGYGVDEQACKMTDDFHTYGFDMQDDYLTFYFDRQKIAQFPNDGTYGGEKYDREMFVLIDLAYGGGGAASNNISHLIGHPADLEVEYVRVWQGSGGSTPPSTTAAELPETASFTVSDFALYGGQQIQTKGATFKFATTGNLEVWDNAANKRVWYSNTSLTKDGTPRDCASGCVVRYQNDGNMVAAFSDGGGWGSNTGSNWGRPCAMLVLMSQDPFLTINDGDCNSVWSIHNASTGVYVPP